MPLILLLLFIVTPLVELVVIMQVGNVIGVLPTVALLVVDSIAGGLLLRREGTRAWQRFREALAEARLPASEVVDGALVVLGGALMLAPGFVTDALGLLLIVPVTRAGIRRIVSRRMQVLTVDAVTGRRPGWPGSVGRSTSSPPPRSDRSSWGRRPGSRRPGGRRPGDGRLGGHRPGPGGPRPAGGRVDPDRGDNEIVDIEVVSIEREERPKAPPE